MMEVSPAKVLVSACTEYILSMKRQCTVRGRYRNYRISVENTVHIKRVRLRNCSFLNVSQFA